MTRRTPRRPPGLRSFVVAAIVIVAGSWPAACRNAPIGPPPAQRIAGEWQVPAPSDWIDLGPRLDAGEPGQWDRILWGGFTNSIVEKDGVFHLYYQGSDSFRTVIDATVCRRSIGLATADADHVFRKHPDNPVLTWSPTDECEEGAVAGAAVLAEDGDVLLYYGANTSTSRTKVSADVRLARSANGLDFEDQGIVLAHDDRRVWGHGDELFPLLSLRDGSRHVVYYVPNGRLSRPHLGVAWGSSPRELTESVAARGPDRDRIPVWGAMGAGRVGPGRFAIFLRENVSSPVEVRMVSTRDPASLSAPVETYPNDGSLSVSVLFDEDARQWLMVYRRDDHYGVKVAPAVRVPGARD